MIPKEAKTHYDKKRCYDWLVQNGDRPATTEFVYFEDDNNNLLAVLGLEIKYCYEPCHSTEPILTQRLFDYATGKARTLGFNKVHIFTRNKKLLEVLKRKTNGRKWSKGITEVLIEL